MSHPNQSVSRKGGVSQPPPMCGSWVQRDVQACYRRRLGNVFKRSVWKGPQGGGDFRGHFCPPAVSSPLPQLSKHSCSTSHWEAGLHPQEQRLVSAHISASFSCLLETALPNLGMTSDLSVQGWAGDPAGPAPSHSRADTETGLLSFQTPKHRDCYDAGHQRRPCPFRKPL